MCAARMQKRAIGYFMSCVQAPPSLLPSPSLRFRSTVLYTGRHPSQALALDYSSPQEATFLLCHGPDNIVDDTGPTRTGTRNSGSVEPYEAVFQASDAGHVRQIVSLTSVRTPKLACLFERRLVQRRSGCALRWYNRASQLFVTCGEKHRHRP